MDLPSAISNKRPAPATAGGLLLRDTLTFLILSFVAVALFGVTEFLFHSFESRREDLGVEWSSRGRQALNAGQPVAAASALRTALSYRPGDRDDELLLARALAGSGHTDEAANYLLGLWDQHPGDGFVNLQLARLERRRGDAAEAVNYYRASIFGTWEGDGVLRRRDVRLELADYLRSRGQLAEARSEVLIAAGNSVDRPAENLLFGVRLMALGDSQDALALYKKALTADPRDATALEHAGRAAFALAQYGEAAGYLSRALEALPAKPADAAHRADLEATLHAARRLPELSMARTLPAEERTAHILAAAAIAQQRLAGCATQMSPADAPANGLAKAAAMPNPALPAALSALQGRWKAAAPQLTRRALLHDASAEDAAAGLIDDTETTTATVCGAPTGDDALLLQMAREEH